MTYDFTAHLDRRGCDALAVDAIGTADCAISAPKAGFDPIPMWVADMNFPVLPSIPRAISARLEHPTFGYFRPRAEYFQAIMDWHRTRKGVTDLTPEHIGYENGVLGGVVTAANILCSRGDQILVNSPTYIGFTHSLENCGYELVLSSMYLDETGVWRLDLQDMEAKLRTRHIHTAIFCSPHNPTGRVWERWEIEAVMELYRRYDVTVISDEIWSDILLNGAVHIPTQSVSEDAKMRTIALYAPSKTFNLAGLVGSYHIIYNDRLRSRHRKESSLSHYNAMNVLSMHALLGAYCPEGQRWVEELNQVLSENVNWAVDFIRSNFPGVTLSKPQGTYMLFLDCTEWCRTTGKTMDALLRLGWDVGVCWQDGRPFHGEHHIRMNLALPTTRVKEAFRRLKAHVF